MVEQQNKASQLNKDNVSDVEHISSQVGVDCTLSLENENPEKHDTVDSKNLYNLYDPVQKFFDKQNVEDTTTAHNTPSQRLDTSEKEKPDIISSPSDPAHNFKFDHDLLSLIESVQETTV
jgi:hypothetical protein